MHRFQVVHGAAVMKPANFDHFAQRYLAGESAQKLSKELQVKSDTVTRWLRQSGIEPRSKAEANTGVLASSAMAQEIVARYVAGESENALAKAFGFSRTPIRRLLVQNGIHIRDQSESELLKWAGMSDERRKHQVAKAHQARRGQKDSFEVQAKRARAWHHRTSHQSWREDALGQAIYECGLFVEYQAPIGPYNLDLSIGGMSISVEIECGNWGRPRTSEQYRERIKYILNQGWRILFVFAKNCDLAFPAITDKVIAYYKFACGDESTRGKYGMVRGDGETVSTRTMNLDCFPRIVGF